MGDNEARIDRATLDLAGREISLDTHVRNQLGKSFS
jgi:hypothetical protein